MQTAETRSETLQSAVTHRIKNGAAGISHLVTRLGAHISGDRAGISVDEASSSNLILSRDCWVLVPAPGAATPPDGPDPKHTLAPPSRTSRKGSDFPLSGQSEVCNSATLHRQPTGSRSARTPARRALIRRRPSARARMRSARGQCGQQRCASDDVCSCCGDDRAAAGDDL